jgi:hypothetical protein
VPLIAYRLQPWAFVDCLVLDLCPPGFQVVAMACDASLAERASALAGADS